MELYTPNTNEEIRLSQIADQTYTPLGGVIELLPLCNMDCKMCYVRMSKEEMDAQGTMLSCDEWLRIADEAIAAGTLFFTLTGGEPLLYPGFKKLYKSLAEHGCILCVNTNGTLIDEEWAEFFAQTGCRRLSITLYGADNHTYEKLCGNPHGFTQVMNAARLLKERKVAFRFTCSLTPHNEHQLDQLHKIANDMGTRLSVATYMFPAERKGIHAEMQYRFTPEQAAAATIKNFQLLNPKVPLDQGAKKTLMEIQKTPYLHHTSEGFSCRAGRSAYWLTWKGEMMPCGVFNAYAIDLKNQSFASAWKQLVEACKQTKLCRICRDCPMQNICRPCVANSYTETGRADGLPLYNCLMTKELVRLCVEYIEKAKK